MTSELHIITPEYPPQPGGVSDYTAQVAEGLAQEGEEVHVWCPGNARCDPFPPAAFTSIATSGAFHAGDLRAVGRH